MHDSPSRPAAAAVQPAAYDSWARYYDLGEGDREPFLKFYRGLLAASTRSILEVGCGTGVIASSLARHLREAAHPGHGQLIRVTGLDASAAMLQIARTRDPSVEWILGDMRDAVAGQFDFVFCCFNTYQFMLSEADLALAFQAARSNTAPGGRFAFDLYQPNIDYISRRRENTLARTVSHQGRLLEIREDSAYDPVHRLLDLNWRLVEADRPENILARTSFRIRQYFAADVQAQLDRAGFRTLERFGGLDRSPLTDSSKKQVWICEPC